MCEFKLLLMFSVFFGVGHSAGPIIFDCPSHDILMRLSAHHEYILVTWREPYSLEGIVRDRSSGHISPHYFRKGEHEVRYTFTDLSTEQSSECNFLVVVRGPEEIDKDPPTIQCPDDITQSVTSATQTIQVTWPPPLYSDNSGIVEVIQQTFFPGSEFPFGFTPVTITVRDAENFTASCTFTVKVGLSGDNMPPVIVGCPSDITHVVSSGRRGAVYWIPPTTRDVSPVRLLFQSHTPGDTFNEGMTTILYLYEDSSGNKVECSFIVTIQIDQVIPEVSNCPYEVRRTIPPGEFQTRVSWLPPTAIDGSGNVRLWNQSHTPGSLFGVGIENVTYIFADPTGNMAMCIFPVIIDVADTTPPVVTECGDTISAVYIVPLGTESRSVSWHLPRAYDNSGTVILQSSTHVPGSSFHIGSTEVSYQFTDLTGNIAYCNFTVMVQQDDDKIAPIVKNCPSDFTVEIPTNGWQVFWASPTATDNTGEVRLASVSHDSGSRFYEGNQTVVYTFADLSGNQAICSFVVQAITIKDQAVKDCPRNINITIPSDISAVVVTWNTEPKLQHIEMNNNVTQSHKSGDLFEVGITRVEYMWHGTNFICKFDVHVENGENNMKSAGKLSSLSLGLLIGCSVLGLILIVLFINRIVKWLRDE